MNADANENADLRSDEPPLHPRAARLKLGHAKDYLAFLAFARRAKLRLHEDTSVLDHEIAKGAAYGYAL